jgi:hypothetical protein
MERLMWRECMEIIAEQIMKTIERACPSLIGFGCLMTT